MDDKKLRKLLKRTSKKMAELSSENSKLKEKEKTKDKMKEDVKAGDSEGTAVAKVVEKTLKDAGVSKEEAKMTAEGVKEAVDEEVEKKDEVAEEEKVNLLTLSEDESLPKSARQAIVRMTKAGNVKEAAQCMIRTIRSLKSANISTGSLGSFAGSSKNKEADSLIREMNKFISS